MLGVVYIALSASPLQFLAVLHQLFYDIVPLLPINDQISLVIIMMMANVRFTVDIGAELWEADRFEFIVIPDRDSFNGVRQPTSRETWVGYVLVPVPTGPVYLPNDWLGSGFTERAHTLMPFLKEYFINIPLFIRYGFVAELIVRKGREESAFRSLHERCNFIISDARW